VGVAVDGARVTALQVPDPATKPEGSEIK
jgi:hypothetical protein